MIIGKGDIASILKDREGAIFFASGVSNSSEQKDSEYKREFDLIKQQDKTKCLFYFSSITVDDPSKQLNRYIRHKKQMEKYIDDNFQNYNIIRIGNITWGKNPNTFLNYIKIKIEKGESVDLRDEFKYMIDKEELLLLTNNLPLTGKNKISVFGKMAKVKDLI